MVNMDNNSIFKKGLILLCPFPSTLLDSFISMHFLASSHSQTDSDDTAPSGFCGCCCYSDKTVDLQTQM